MAFITSLFSKLRDAYPKPTLLTKIVDGVEVPYARELRGRYWKDALGKITYLTGQKGLLMPNNRNYMLDDDLEFNLAITGGVHQFIESIARQTNESFQKFVDVPSLSHRIKVSKSHFWTQGLYDTMEKYITRGSVERDFEPDPSVRNFYFSHLKIYETGTRLLLKYSEEEQTEKLLAGVITGTSAGWDQWSKQSKNKFAAEFEKFTARLGHKYSFTVSGILDAVSASLNNKHFPPFTLFYRTQGGTSKKIRAVFGGNILARRS